MTLATPNPRVLCDLAGGIMENAMKREIKSGKIELIVNDQKELQYSADAQNGDMLAFYEFFDF